MGQWIYYVTSMPFKDVAERIQYSHELNSSVALGQLIQRELTDRSKGIATYLTTQDERFFNSLIIAVFEGQPDWVDLAIPGVGDPSLPDLDVDSEKRISDTLGLLRFNGEESLFALDGQHRVAGIREALKKKPSLASEEVSVILVGHESSKEGRIRTRRLFSTLNRYAVKVSQPEIVALDEDDAGAIVTRKLLDDHPLLKGTRVAIGKTDPDTKEILALNKAMSLPAADKTSLTTILTVYSIATTLLLNRQIGGKVWKHEALHWPRPKDKDLATLYRECKGFWDLLGSTFPEVQRVRKAHDPTGIAGSYRTADGGHLLFRPIGQMAFAIAIRDLMKQQLSMSEAFALLKRLDYSLTHPAWSGVLWNHATDTMLTTGTSRDVAAGLMVHFVGRNQNQAALLRKYRQLKLIENPEAVLPAMNIDGR